MRLHGKLNLAALTSAGALAALPLPLPLPIPQNPPAPKAPAPTPPPPRDRAAFIHSFPDPAVMRVGRTYYAYATSDRSGLFPILRSRDLVHWRRAGHAMARRPAFAYKEFWAPHPVRWRGRYHLFYSAHARNPDKSCVAVATARRPTGPFRHRARLTCEGTGGALDPAPTVVGKRIVLYFARTDAYCAQFRSRCQLRAASLNRDLRRIRGRSRRVLGINQPWEVSPTYAIVENPSVFKRGRRYYMLYSANDWRGAYGMGYATARSPFGPFRKPRHNPFLRTAGTIAGPGGGSAFTTRRGRLWLAYHARRAAGAGDNPRRRSLHLQPLRVAGGRVWTPGRPLQSRILP